MGGLDEDMDLLEVQSMRVFALLAECVEVEAAGLVRALRCGETRTKDKTRWTR